MVASLLVVIFNASALDNPHNTNNSISCGDCHITPLSNTTTWWTNQGEETGVCGQCHNAAALGSDVLTHSSSNTSTQYGTWDKKCTDCHNPHSQRQNVKWKTLSYLTSGAISTVTTTTLTKTGANWNTTDNGGLGEWAGMILIPNVSYQGRNHRIVSNTSDTITISTIGGDAINTVYAKTGNTFAIVYGKLVKEVVNGKYVKFFRQTGANSFADGDGTIDGVCEVCHTQTKNPNSSVPRFRSTGNSDNHYTGQSCKGCHVHSIGFKASCAGCHGNPPVDTSKLVGFTNPSSTGSVTEGAHNSHVTTQSISCSACHYNSVGAGSTHNSGNTVTIGFYNFSGSAQGGAYNGQSTVAYNATSTSPATTTSSGNLKECSNIYCHGSTMSPNGGTDITPVWDNPATAACGTCHGANTLSSTNSPTRGSHTMHTGGGKQLPCSDCHNGYTPSGILSGMSTHINNAANFAFDSAKNYIGSASYSGDTTMLNAYGTCSNLYCHGNYNGSGLNAVPTWGDSASGVCGTCHGATNATTPASGKHKRHASTGMTGARYDREYACTLCHKDIVVGGTSSGYTISDKSKHASGFIDWKFDIDDSRVSASSAYTIASGTAVPSNGTTPRSYGSCSNVYCHSTVQPNGGTGAPVYDTVQWGTTVNCSNKCHAGADLTYMHGTNISTGSHSRHMAYTLNSYQINKCTICHKWNTAIAGVFDGTTCTNSCHSSPEKTLHADGSVNVVFDTYFGTGVYNGTPAPGDGYSNCSNTYCHSNGTSVSSGAIPDNTSANWGSGTLACNSCHNNPPNYASGSPKTNSHTAHSAYTCNACHNLTTTNGTTITNPANHVNKSYTLEDGGGHNFVYTYNTSGGSCSTISCHSSGYQSATWGASGCLDCHSVSVGSRAAITSQFSANSHHIQGTVSNDKCYQCHWEADSNGRITSYHGGSAASGSAVDLVIYGAGSRPTSTPYTSGTTGIAYTANGLRTEIQKINQHCLGCHDEDSKNAIPFGDSKKTSQYAWDSQSVGVKYSSMSTITWGKYTTTANAAKKDITKAYSAHGNAANNIRGWDTANGVDGTITNTSGSTNVVCFDCHNSHGSGVTGTTTSYTSAMTNGGILKTTTANKGGYTMNYTPVSGGSAGNKNAYNPGAGLCFDCHLNAAAGTTTSGSYRTLWGYQGTFGATQSIMGYWDTAYFGPGTFGPQSRYAYKAGTSHQGGHFGASTPLSGPPAINGLCTPCHDPHGISPNLSNQQYGVPLLKGTWMTSPYKEDAAPASNTQETIHDVNAGNVYHIDQNTFGTHVMDSVTGITQADTEFAGLCLNCHTKNSLTNGVSGGTWKSVDRIHESVKSWGANAKHKYTCSKCHVPHNSTLPRLMATNCLNQSHKGRVGYNSSPVISGSGSDCDLTLYPGSGTGGWCGSGSGNFPGSGSGPEYSYTMSCHESQTGSTADQSWNTVTPWATPVLSSPTAISIGSTTATLGANITSNGGSAITARGTVWGTSANPTSNVLAEGGITTGVFSHARSGLPAGTKVYYRGYATNSDGTGYSPDGSFYTEPSTQASGVSFTSVSGTGMTVNWTRGNGDGVIVLMKQASAVDSNPADGTYTTYTANAPFGSGTQIGTGNYVVYKSTGTSVNVTGLSGGTTYYVAIYEYKGTVDTSEVNQGTNYKPTPATGNQATISVSPLLSSPTATSISTTTATLGANITSNGGSAITARGTVWGTAANPTSNALAEGGTTTGVFSHARSGLTAGTKIYYRGYATNSVGTGYSPDGSFYTEPSNQASTVSFTSVGDTGMTVNWARGNGDGVIVLMKLGSAVDSSPADGTYTYNANAIFGSGTQIGAGNYVVYRGTGTSVAVTGLGSGTTYYAAVYEYKGTVDTSGVDQGTNYKPSPATGSQTTTGTPVPPSSPTLSWPTMPYSGQVGYPLGTNLLQWNASSGATEYYCEYWNSGFTWNTGWTTALSWDTGDLSDNLDYWWHCKAKNASGESGWSATWTWYDYWDDGGSCPMLYTWDGTNYTFESDMFGTGKLGLPKSPSGFIKPNPHDYYLLVNEPVLKDSFYEIRMVEERPETNYLDKLNLYTIDLPANKEVYAEIPKVGGGYVTAGQILHTVEKPLKHPVSVTHVNTGADVSAKLADDDGDRLLLNEDKEVYDYQTLELDLGDLSAAPMVKLVINAVSAFPDTTAGQERMKLFSAHTKLEVLDSNGNWVLVPTSTTALAKPKEIRRIHAVNITGAFLTSTYKVRLTYLFQTYIDSIYFDTSADEPVTINEVPFVSADLRYYGFSRRIESPGLVDFFYGDKIDGTKFPIMPGNYTRFGDVGPLLASTDDKFVIFGTGDEIQMKFASPPAQPENTTRKYLLYMAGYYKNFRTPVIDFTVEPLPFAAMSNFPYDEAVEHYPDDPEHQQYLLEYNTREYFQ